MAKGGVVEAPYYQPKLGFENESTLIPAVLMLFGFTKTESVGKDKYLAIVDTIYFKHYCRWYARYKETIETYTKETKGLRQRIEREVNRVELIKVNGAIHPFDSRPHSIRYSKEVSNLSFIMTSALFVVFLMMVILEIQRIYDIPLYAISFVFMLALVCFFAVYATLSKNAMKVLIRLLQFLRFFSRRIR